MLSKGDVYIQILKVKDLDVDTIYYYPICNVVSLEKYYFNENNDYRIKVALTDGRFLNFSTITSEISIINDNVLRI